MVGIVLVSHSPKVAEGLRDLLQQLVRESVVVAIAGGTREGGLGTDATLIAEAIGLAERGDGVAVLMDLGSAVLSASLARDLLPAEAQGRVALCDAPLVEGAVAAAVMASLGVPLAEVQKSAEEARGLAKL
jgi:phosphoenolpyruvate---glycerone phosphotransferase subunit DhaM